MEPIISPIFIYILSVINRFISLLHVFIFLLVVVMILSPLIADKFSETDEDGIVLFKKIIKICGISIIIITTALVFMPDKETMMLLYASKYVTVDNIVLGKEMVIDTIKGIMSVINK